MAKRYGTISPVLQRFIEAQHLFFVATAAADGRVNISPKGMDTLRVLGTDRIVWSNVTGSGNETAAHLAASPRITLMWCAFEGHPQILRCYGTARAVHRHDEGWDELIAAVGERPGARQVVDCTIDLVQTSCGMAVPLMDFVADRDDLDRWATAKGPDGLAAYWRQKNTTSLDGAPITRPT
jgi:hypothetical protein